jgi:predicted ATP-binding protein involved in virulence
MKLESLKLTNFRGFREFEITFDPQFTVLLGGNMAGKTAVLDAATVAISPILESFCIRNIEEDEVRRVVTSSGGIPELQKTFPVVIEPKVLVADLALQHPRWDRWQLTYDEAERGTRINRLAYTVLNRSLGEDLPVIAQYSVQRYWDRNKSADDVRGIGSRYDGYESCFNISSTHATLAGWMRKQTLVQLQRGGGYVQPQLAAVEAAVKCCIADATRFWYDVEYDELRLELADGDIQSFTMLSEGVRNMVAMIADIAWRAAVLNPQHGSQANLLTEGVVLIDEIDLHLHPAWQRRVVGDLVRTFPRIQFIVTTHSPQIVASVRRDQVRLLDRNQLVSGSPYVEGRDSSEILEDVFGVTARPEAAKAEIDALFRLIEDEDFAAARQHLAALEERLGPHDAEMVRARWILDTEEAQANRRPAAAP